MFRLRILLLLGLVIASASVEARRTVDPIFAASADDPALINSILRLGPGISVDEARAVAGTAYTTGREFRKKWRMVWPPGYHNFLIRVGKREAGMCFQFAAELLWRLDALKLKTLDYHWAESFDGTPSEHNVIVITPKNGPFAEGIILDNWRYGGRLVWGKAKEDPHYKWTENQREMEYRLRTRSIAAHGRNFVIPPPREPAPSQPGSPNVVREESLPQTEGGG